MAQKVKPDARSTGKVVLDILRCCHDSDTEAADAVKALEALARGIALARKLNPISKAVADFDFDQALSLMNQLML